MRRLGFSLLLVSFASACAHRPTAAHSYGSATEGGSHTASSTGAAVDEDSDAAYSSRTALEQDALAGSFYGSEAPHYCEAATQNSRNRAVARPVEPPAWPNWGGENRLESDTRILVRSGTELQDAVDRQQDVSKPLTILVVGSINSENSPNLGWIDVRDVSNVSIIGAGAGAEFHRIGIRLRRVRNVTIRKLYVPSLLVGEVDAVGLEGLVDHAWVDNSELSENLDDTTNPQENKLAQDQLSRCPTRSQCSQEAGGA